MVQRYDDNAPGWQIRSHDDRYYVADLNVDNKSDLVVFNAKHARILSHIAVKPVLSWHGEDGESFRKAATESTYLGHTTVTDTEVYLYATAELKASNGRPLDWVLSYPSFPCVGMAKRA
jgi:hypothetical protein